MHTNYGRGLQRVCSAAFVQVTEPRRASCDKREKIRQLRNSKERVKGKTGREKEKGTNEQVDYEKNGEDGRRNDGWSNDRR